MTRSCQRSRNRLVLNELVQLVAIFFNCEPNVVVKLRHDVIAFDDLLFGIMKTIHIGMRERLFGRDSLVRIELQKPSEQVKAVLSSARDEIFNASLLARRSTLDDARSVVRLNAVNVVFGGRWNVFEYSFKLIERRSAREDRRAQEHLAQYASNAPHVHTFGVLGRGEQDLGRSVPSSGHVLGQGRIRVLGIVSFVSQRSSQTEIAELHVTFLIEKDIGRLLVTMNHIGRMQVLGSLEQLVHDVLFVNIFQDRLALDDIVQISFYKTTSKFRV